MVGEEKVSRSEAQGPRPEDSQKRKHGRPSQAQRAVNELLAAVQPLLHGFKSALQRRKCRARRIQAAAPAAEGGRIGEAIRIFQRRRGAFPRVVLHKTSPQRGTARDQAEMGVGQGESGEETES